MIEVILAAICIWLLLRTGRKSMQNKEEFTAAEKATAEELGISVEEVRRILDVYMNHCKLSAAKRRMLRKD